jgi:hypothetical protein
LTLNQSMLGRRQINATADSHAPLRSSLADAAFAVEERLVWGGADVLRRVFEIVKWPFERAAWAIERGLIWPVEERTGEWNGPLRAAGMAALALLAVGAGVLGLLWASGSGGGNDQTLRQAAVPVTPPAVQPAPQEKLAKAAPVLHGAAPKFVPESGDAAKAVAGNPTKAGGEAADTTATDATSTSDTPTSSAGVPVQPAGPVATKVAHQFAAAFVLYETGKTDAKVREAFTATTTPQLAHSLLQRPPRLPADANVPKAKVLNIVPGPKQGETYTLSVSLLRVGITTELRLNMQREKSGEWRVTDVRG